ncbi:glycosyltransferase [Muricoccus radiodurans]|uniref:glycosyltransferase n=1 Tax=Muricoccus radiodurans TaxID=2231721 RepID=UPI003CF9E7DF
MSTSTARGPEGGWTFLLEEGHRLRRQGLHAAALSHYADAASQAPAEAAPHLHRGHALRLLGRDAEAEQAYALAAALDPLDHAAGRARDAMHSGGPVPDVPTPATPDPPVLPPPAPAPIARPLPSGAVPSHRPRMAMMRAGATMPSGGMRPLAASPAARSVAPGSGTEIAFDISDLLLHFDHSRTPTGIQRVQAGVVGAALRRGAPEHRFIAFDSAASAWREVPRDALGDLLRLASASGDPLEDEWVAARDGLRACVVAARTALFQPGSVLTNLGNSWGLRDYFRALRTAQRAGGALYIPFLHDCVPLVMPEHCVRTLVEDYARWFGGMALHAHAVLCNSEATRADGRRHLAALAPDLDIPFEVVRLDADPRGTASPDRAALAALGGPRPGEAYVLFVATIESRKDHLTVFRAWLNLIRRHGAGRIPRLICVGHRGWHAEAALGLLENSPELAARVTLMHGVPDPALAALYEGCRFTVYNSHHEGWGLPVTESIAWGKVPVVPRHSALLESGGEAAIFVTPGSEADLADTVERLILDPGALPAAEARLRAGRRPRSWETVEAEVIEHLGEAARRPSRPPEARAGIRPGITLRTRRETTLHPSLDLAVAEAVREGGGWYPPEGWGCWSRGGLAALRLPVDESLAGQRVRVALELRLPDGIGEVGLRVGADAAAGGRIAAGTAGDVAVGFALDLPEEARDVSVQIESGSATVQGESGEVGVGLRGVMLCREDDLESRLLFLEAQRLSAGP